MTINSQLRIAASIGFGVVLAVLAGAQADPPAVDGLFDEWSEATLLATDAANDSSGAFDITEVHALNRGSQLFVHFDTTAVLNIQSGPDEEGTLRLELELPGQQQLTIDFRNRTAYANGDPDDFVPWSDVDYVSMSTYAANRFELRVDLSAFGTSTGDSLMIDFSGSDSLDKPVPFTLALPPAPPTLRSPEREPCTTFRIASLNTLSGGLLDFDRGPAIGRLVQAAAADIYCFQEQNSSVELIAARLLELDPLGSGDDWNVYRSADTIIAGNDPIIPIPHAGDAAAILDMGSRGVVGVFSIHPPCCGFIGNSQDLARIAEMQGIVDTIAELRAGLLGAPLWPYRFAPIIIIGDWNLVGSRTPLDLAEDPKGPNQTHRLLSHLVGSDVTTWRSFNEFPGSFSPGLLDLLTYSTGGLISRNGFVLDSAELTSELLKTLQLEPADSLASDHLMLVGDFATFANGDLNGDGDTGPADLAMLLGSWGPCLGCPADLNGDGIIGPLDLAMLLAAWGSCG